MLNVLPSIAHFQQATHTKLSDENFVAVANKVYHLAGLLDGILPRVELLDNKCHDTIPTIHTTSVMVALAHSMAQELSDWLTDIDLGEAA